MSKIALNMIIRNCADFIEKALNSTIGHVDYYCIGFGGKSDDNTEEVVKKWLRQSYIPYKTIDIIWSDDFAKARNSVLEATQKEWQDVDWLFWMDADDVLLSKTNLHVIADNSTGEVIQFAYFYQVDEKGNVIVWHSRERLVNLKLPWNWVGPVHETLVTPIPHSVIFTDDAYIKHDDSKTKERSERNKRILFSWQEKEPNNRRVVLYLGHSFYSNQQYEDAIKYFAQYFYSPENPLEQWSAAVFAGRSAMAMEQYEEASGWFHHAVDLYPQWKDGWLGLAGAHTRLRNYEAAVQFFKESDNKGKPPNILFIVENEYDWNRWCYEHEALSQTGDIEGALEITKKALERNPEHQGFMFYYYGYQEAVDAKKSIEALKHLALTELRRGDGIKALKLLDECVPVNVQEEPEVKTLRNYVYSGIEHAWNTDLLFQLNKEGNKKGHESEDGADKDDTFNFLIRFPRVQAVIEILKPHIEKAKKENRKLRIIDLACAGGGISMKLAEMFDIEVVGVDGDKDSVDTANKRAKDWGIKNISFIQSDLNILDAQRLGRFDVALLQEIIEHTYKPAFFVGLATELAPVVIITTPHQMCVLPNDGRIRNPRNNVPLYPHVIEFGRADMEKLGAMSGYAIHNLNTVYDSVNLAPGCGSWAMELREERLEKPPVVFYCGFSGGEEWTPKQINEQGLGGSETAAIKMAEAFVKKGHIVVVYGATDGVYNGVIYRKADKFNPAGPALNQPAWLFITSRIPDVMDNEVNAVVKALWCHDNTFKLPVVGGYVDRLTPERAEKLDYILVLSEWAKNFMAKQYPFVPDSKWVVTENAIESINFNKPDSEITRKSHSFIYASSADRGLEKILDIWPKIKKNWKDAELDIFYGLDVMQKIHGNIPGVQDFMQRIIVKSDQKGINWKGRIGQAKLAEEFKAHQFWLYPTDFEETFCITALEAQAGGCIPLTTNVAALKERVPEEFRLDWRNGTEFVDQLKKLDNKYGLKAPSKLKKEALKYTWERVADQWERLAYGKK